jgi:DNA ligase (NAD+)
MFFILKKLCFLTPEYYILSSYQEVEGMKQKYQSSLRDKFDFELDGLVAHNNNIQKLESFGVVNNRPKGSIAIKFDSISKEATIADVIIQVGSSGRLTPVAVFNPKVNLMGAEIEKASLHNFSNISELGIDIGCKVLVCRSNDVIPYVEEVINSTGTIFKSPAHCPSCGTKVISSGEYVQCPNVKDCYPQKSGRIINWITELSVKEWGEALIDRLVQSAKVNTIADLYKLSIKDLSEIDRMGIKSAKKCHEILHANKEIPLEIFLSGLSIPLIGQSTIKLIMSAGHDNLSKMFDATSLDFEKITGLGPVKAKSFKIGLHENKQLIDDILASGVSIKQKTFGKLTGYSFCFTGTMENKRSVLEKMASDEGADIKSTVSKDLSFLVIADPENSTSSKAVNARKFGTKLISENDFIKMVNS